MKLGGTTLCSLISCIHSNHGLGEVHLFLHGTHSCADPLTTSGPLIGPRTLNSGTFLGAGAYVAEFLLTSALFSLFSAEVVERGIPGGVCCGQRKLSNS